MPAFVLPEMSDFDGELEQELHRILDPLVAAPIPARRAISTRGWRRRLLGGAGAALTVKVLTGVAAAAAAATIAGAATEVATTGSLNPLVWGQQVKQTVQQCKDTLRASGTRGIGQCVSAFANQHGSSRSEQGSKHGQGNGNGNGTGNGNGNSNGNGNGNGNGNDKDKGHGNGQGDPHGHPSGKVPGQDQPGPPPVPAN